MRVRRAARQPPGSKWSLMSTKLAARVKRRTVNTARGLSRPLIVHRDSLPVPVRSALRRAHRALPVRIRRALQYPPVAPVIGEELPPRPPVRQAKVRLLVGPANFAGQGWQWARAARTASARCRSRGVRLRQGFTRLSGRLRRSRRDVRQLAPVAAGPGATRLDVVHPRTGGGRAAGAGHPVRIDVRRRAQGAAQGWPERGLHCARLGCQNPQPARPGERVVPVCRHQLGSGSRSRAERHSQRRDHGRLRRPSVRVDA